MTMAESAPGYSRRHDEPQCYNCGTTGHWAIGCPEPTRDTPAGLSWRNMSRPPNNQHPKEQRGGQRWPKAIITRYSQPDGQPSSYAQHSSYPSQGHYTAASYPQPPHPYHPQTHHSQAHYYPQHPPPPNYPQYSQPPQPFAQGYQQPATYSYQPVPPAHPPAYRPNQSGYGAPDYGNQRSPPPPHPPHPPHQSAPPYPTPQRSYTDPAPPPTRQVLSASPPGPPHGFHGPHPSSRSISGPGPQRTPHVRNRDAPYSKTHQSPPQNRPRSHGSTQVSPKGTSLNPLPAGEMALHGLPPKPPAPTGDRQERRHDKRDKQQQNHRNGVRDNRAKDQQGNRRNNKRGRHKRRQNSQGQQLSQPAKDPQVEGGEESRNVRDNSQLDIRGREISETPTEPAEMPKHEEDKAGSSTDPQAAKSTEHLQPQEVALENPDFQHDVQKAGKNGASAQLPVGTQEKNVARANPTRKMSFEEFMKASQHAELSPSPTLTANLQPSPAFFKSSSQSRPEERPTSSRGNCIDRRIETRRYSSPAPQAPDQRHLHSRRESGSKRKWSIDSSPRGNTERALQGSPQRGRDQLAHRRSSRSISPGQQHRQRDRPVSRRPRSPNREPSPKSRSPHRSRRSSVASSGSDSSSLTPLELALLGRSPKAKRQADQDEKEAKKTRRQEKEEADKAARPKKRRQNLGQEFSRRW